jgi:DNA-binding PadR family transcriptional regulator
VLELAVLGLLSEQPLHGYELRKRLADTLGPMWGISFGSLYPALRRLEKSGAIEAVEPVEPTPVIVPTGSVQGDLAAARGRRRPRTGLRTRKAYRITAAGERHFDELLADERDDDERSFALKLSFCRYLTATARLALLERRRAQLTQRLAKTRRNPARTTDRYTRSLLEHRVRTTQHDLEWIEELIALEREAGLSDHPEGAATA